MTLHNRAAATRARASRATKTVIAGHDLAIFERIRIDVPKKQRSIVIAAVVGTPRCGVRSAQRADPTVPLHPELLIEIAVVNFTTPPDADRVAAHEAFDRRWIERFDQELHVLLEPIVVAQVSGEPADRKIRKRVKPVKHNSEILFQFPFVIGLKLVLRRRQKRADGIVNEMQRQRWIDSVT